MIFEIEDKLVASELFERKFVCDLNACKGACCVEGDAGAPVTEEEVKIIEKHLEEIKPYMRPEGIAAVEESGVSYPDDFNEPVTTLVNGKECAFVYFDEKGITKCAIEAAHNDGKLDFKKPISCHLYPIRVKKTKSFQILNYEYWSICAPACTFGEQLNVKVYKFLKEPLIRAYGEVFYKQMEEADTVWENENTGH
ncbi:DUF3109 family protein [Wandonia haliotis]|uniref:DUF3109 family protein n=1 Tax=Wandonia haliotis TaxID=574963 RepID=A0ABP3XYU9_9FLAO